MADVTRPAMDEQLSDSEHHLKNQIASVIGFAERLLENSALEDNHRADVEEILRAARRAMELMMLGPSRTKPVL